MCNNGSKPVPQLYIDHTASAAHGGFLVTTTRNCIKSVMGFSRFALTLQPDEIVEFVVVEEVEYEEVLMASSLALQHFVRTAGPKLVREKIIDSDLVQTMHHVIVREQKVSALRVIERDNITDVRLHQWETSDLGEIVPAAIMAQVHAIRKDEECVREDDRCKRALEARIKTTFANQGRLRSNITSLENMSESPLVKRYLKDLDAEEDQIIASRKKIAQITEQRAHRTKAIAAAKLALSSAAAKLREELTTA